MHVVANLPSTDHATSNLVYVRPGDPIVDKVVALWVCDARGAKLNRAQGAFRVAADDKQALPVGVDPAAFKPIGISSGARSVAKLEVKDLVVAEPVRGLPRAELVVMQVSRLRPKSTEECRIETADIVAWTAYLRGEVPPAPGAKARRWPVNLGFDYYLTPKGMILSCKVVAITAGGDPNCTTAEFTPDTNITFESGQPFLKIKGQNTIQRLFKRDFDISELGIGGLDRQFAEIFRGAFASRAAPPHIAKAMNIQHTKGILLYGPPGTGKTLIARQIGKLLNAVEPKIVNGPEILDKYVGESEKKVRELFADAERDEAALAEDSPLHVIIFDEIDAICKQRGTTGGGTGVHDSIVNTLLTKIDGVESLNNILLIGMTNRPDLLDEALTRPGRIELKIEIGLPDNAGRQQILTIHTGPLVRNKFLEPDVDVAELADRTKNFTGAELQALVRHATNWALDENLNKQNLKDVPKDFHPMISRRHFMSVLENDLKPAFGASEEALASYHQEGMFSFGPRFDRLVRDITSASQLSDAVPKATILLQGSAGTGKTALATYMSGQLHFPFVKLIDFFAVMGKPEAAAADVLKKAFDDATKSPLSILILDDLAKLLQYAKHGPRYSLLLLHTLQSLLKQRPPEGKRLVVIATTGSDVAHTLDLADSFSHVMRMPTLTRDEAVHVLRSCGMVTEPSQLAEAERMLPDAAAFDTTIRTLTATLLNSSPAGVLDLTQWEQWQASFQLL
eukprot:jgi/Ulvmu1/440/UM001_0447.1